MGTAARFTTLTRLGFAARGLLYIVVALLVLNTGRTEDFGGALAYLGQGGGRILLLLMTLGLVAYGLWRLSDAAFDLERHGSGSTGASKRLGSAISGGVHLLLAWQAFRLIKDAGAASQTSAETYAGSALQLPGGGVLLIAVGLLLLGTAVFQLVIAAKGSFLESLEPGIAHRAWAKWTGRLGYAARGIVFAITGIFLLGAGFDQRAAQAGGMADALSWLTSPWDMIVAAGLFAFGLFSLIEARFRVLNDVPVGNMGQRINRKLS